MSHLTTAPIDTAALLARGSADGAVCLFLGVVRDHNGGRAVRHLEYEAYEEMADQMLADLEEDARRRFPVTSVRVVHRLGRMEIGEASVAVAVASAHRGEAFEACRHVIDVLKKTVPIWKKEFYEDGAVWLEGPGEPAREITSREP